MSAGKRHFACASAAILLGAWTAASLAAPRLGGCDVFPSDSVYNTRIDSLPVHAKSGKWVASIGRDTHLHPDFGSGLYQGHVIGIPYNIVSSTQATSTVTFRYAGQSDPGPYPIPANPKTEGGSDRHILMVQRGSCGLFELFAAKKSLTGQWSAGSGAIWDLGSNALRPDTWTSADAAGLPITPLLARADEVQNGAIRHALRFTADVTRHAYLWPARHQASDVTDPDVPPMGARFRLKRGFDVSGFPPDVQVILVALKRYGMFLADNGSNWYINGAADDRWDNDTLHTLSQVPGSAFEVVDESSLMVDPDSGQAVLPAP